MTRILKPRHNADGDRGPLQGLQRVGPAPYNIALARIHDYECTARGLNTYDHRNKVILLITSNGEIFRDSTML